MMVSVIIPTYNGERKINRILESLKNQGYKSFEVIVVMDGSTDNTRQVVKQFEGSLQIHPLVSQNNLGRSKIRNLGASVAKGDLLIFYDDDMEPDSNSVERHVNFHLNNFGILSGNQIEIKDSKKSDIQNYKAYLTQHWIEKYNEGINKLTTENLFFTAANCSIKKEVFFLNGGFDERLTDAEDFDLAQRALQSGIPVYFDKDNIAVHHDPITCRSYINRIRQYQLAHKKLLEIHPERRRKESVKSSIIYKFFSFGLLPFLIDRFNLFRILPLRMRYKAYDVIIHSLGVVSPTVRLW